MKFTFLFCILFLGACSLSNNFKLEESFKKGTHIEDDTIEVKMSDIVDFSWDVMYVFTGPKYPKEIEEIIELPYLNENILQDNYKRYLFVNDSEVVKEIDMFQSDLSFDTNLKPYYKAVYSDIVKVRIRNDFNRNIYTVLSPTSGRR